MKIDIDANLIAQFLDALKTPHIAVIFGMLGVLVIFGWIFIAYVKASKNVAIGMNTDRVTARPCMQDTASTPKKICQHSRHVLRYVASSGCHSVDNQLGIDEG